MEPSWSSCLTFWLQMLRCGVSYSYWWDTSFFFFFRYFFRIVQQTGEQKNVLPKSGPGNSIQDCSPCWPPETITTLLISYYSSRKLSQKKKQLQRESIWFSMEQNTEKEGTCHPLPCSQPVLTLPTARASPRAAHREHRPGEQAHSVGT